MLYDHLGPSSDRQAHIDHAKNDKTTGKHDGGIEKKLLQAPFGIVPTKIPAEGRTEAGTTILQEDRNSEQESENGLADQKRAHKNTAKIEENTFFKPF